MPIDPQIQIGILFILLILAITWIVRLEFRIKKLTTGTNKENLATGLKQVQEFAKRFASFEEYTKQALSNIDGRVKKSIQSVKTVRFDPFSGGVNGGNQSFATSFLDEEQNGVVISTIHTRERVGVFSKPIKNGTSEYDLTPEEESVVKK